MKYFGLKEPAYSEITHDFWYVQAPTVSGIHKISTEKILPGSTATHQYSCCKWIQWQLG